MFVAVHMAYESHHHPSHWNSLSLKCNQVQRRRALLLSCNHACHAPHAPPPSWLGPSQPASSNERLCVRTPDSDLSDPKISSSGFKGWQARAVRHHITVRGRVGEGEFSENMSLHFITLHDFLSRKIELVIFPSLQTFRPMPILP